MADRSAIEWTEATWNPVTGCDRISTGCDHCYAMTLAKRLKAMGSMKYQHDGDPRTSGPGFARLAEWEAAATKIHDQGYCRNVPTTKVAHALRYLYDHRPAMSLRA